LNGRPPDGRAPVGRSPDERSLDEPSPDERGENLGRFGFAVFENDPLGFPGADGRPVDGRPVDGRPPDGRSFEDRSLDGRSLENGLLKAGRAGLSPSRTNGLFGFWGADSRFSSRGAEVDLGVFLPYFANALGFENFGGLSPCDRGENSGLPGFEVREKEEPDLAGADGRAPDGARPKLGFAPRLSALAKAPEGLPGIEDRVSGRGENFEPAGFSPNFLNDLSGFTNVEARCGAGRGINFG
jgi:hypothetical protein